MDSIFYKSLRSDSCLYQTIKSYMDFFKMEELISVSVYGQ